MITYYNFLNLNKLIKKHIQFMYFRPYFLFGTVARGLKAGGELL